MFKCQLANWLLAKEIKKSDTLSKILLAYWLLAVLIAIFKGLVFIPEHSEKSREGIKFFRCAGRGGSKIFQVGDRGRILQKFPFQVGDRGRMFPKFSKK